MPRIAEKRAPARPNSPQQQERVRRILGAAARQGAVHGLERVQMHEIAKESGVAIATLYRYFPSKMHLFTAVMRDRVIRMGDRLGPRDPEQDPVLAVTDLLIRATHDMAAAPRLAQAMMISNNTALHAGESIGLETSETFSALFLSTAGIEEPTPEDEQLVRLVQQGWYGLITAALNQHMTQEQFEDDIRVLCQLLLARWSRS